MEQPLPAGRHPRMTVADLRIAPLEAVDRPVGDPEIDAEHREQLGEEGPKLVPAGAMETADGAG